MRTPKGLSRALFVMMMVCTTLGMEAAEENEEKKLKAPENRNLWRLAWDNDAFVHTDNAFTNGWSLQRHSHQHDGWDEMGPSRFSGAFSFVSSFPSAASMPAGGQTIIVTNSTRESPFGVRIYHVPRS